MIGARAIDHKRTQRRKGEKKKEKERNQKKPLEKKNLPGQSPPFFLLPDKKKDQAAVTATLHPQCSGQ